jgi:beta-ribofuranosylaminobenzene 5'-phosphate synthase
MVKNHQDKSSQYEQQIARKNEVPIVHLTSFARLHMGFFDLHGGLGRKFGSIGLSLSAPSLQLTARPSEQVTVDTTASAPVEVMAKALQLSQDFLQKLGLAKGVDLTLHNYIPSHAGLGSGTQMALSIGSAINRLYGLGLTTAEIAVLTGRGGRSGIGIAAFDVGGVLIDGGQSTAQQSAEVPPLLARYDWPLEWRIVLIFDLQSLGVHGQKESAAFKQLPAFPEEVAADLCRHLLMQIMPALVQRDLESFGRGLQVLQAQTGDYFAPVQGGRYASPLVAEALAYLQSRGVACFGQSSWGPTGFAVFEGLGEAEVMVEDLKSTFKSNGLTYLICGARNQGAQID